MTFDNNNIFNSAIKQNNIHVIEFMINEGLVNNINITNNNNENVLHLLTKNVHKLQHGAGTIEKAIQISNASTINQQDNEGNTPIINIVGGKHPDSDRIGYMLKQAGADISIRNKLGTQVGMIDTIASDNYSLNESQDTEIFMNGGNANTYSFSMKSEGSDSSMCVNSKFEELYNQLSDMPININRVINTNNTKIGGHKQLNDDLSSSFSMNQNSTMSESNKYFEKLIDNIHNNNINKNTTINKDFNSLIGGSSLLMDNDSESDCNIATEQIKAMLFGKHMHSGGSKLSPLSEDNIIRGTRMLKTVEKQSLSSNGSNNKYTNKSIPSYSDVSLQSNMDSSHLSGGSPSVKAEFRKYARQLSRLVDSQKTQTFEKVVKKIKDLLSVDEETARFYKTTLIHMAKKKNPNLTGLDLATEVDALATYDNLKEIDIEKEKKIIMTKRSERSAESDSSKSHTPIKKHNKKTIVTSSESESETESESESNSDSDLDNISKKKLLKNKKVAKKDKNKELKRTSHRYQRHGESTSVSAISLNDFSMSSQSQSLS